MPKVYMNELAAAIAEKLQIDDRKVAFHFVSSVVSVIKAGLEKDRLVKIKGLGTFKVIDVDARESVNVNSGERLLIEGHSKLTFTPDTAMKELVNKPFSQFETVVLNDGVNFDDVNELDEEEEEAPSPIEEVMPQPIEEEKPEEPAVELEAPVIEPEEPVVEPEVPVVELEEPVVPQEEPMVELEEPDIEETPVPLMDQSQETEQEDAPASDEEEGTPEEAQPEEDEEQMDEDESVEPSKRNKLMWPLIALLAFCIGGVGGYFVGHENLFSSAKAPVATVSSPKKAPVAKKTEAPKQEEVATPVVEEQQPETPQQSETPQQEAATNVPEWEKYNQMDVRLRDGAYFIMGLDRMEKVRAGDNSKRIASRVYGGSDMACYIEVYNGIDASTALEPGTEIKIPKIETKKSVRKKLQQNNQ